MNNGQLSLGQSAWLGQDEICVGELDGRRRSPFVPRCAPWSPRCQRSDRVNAMAKPRREPRHVVPAISFSIRVDFQVESELYVGRLWDISKTGACIVFPPHHRVKMGSSGPLVMHHPNVGEPICARGELLWIDDLGHALYTGFRLLDPIDFEITFLRMLLGRSSGTSSADRLRSLRDVPLDFESFDA